MFRRNKFQKNKNKIFTFIRKKIDHHPLVKFILVFALILAYFLYVTKAHGAENGLWISLLTWSFFVLCTPIADAGILLDFPLKIITNIRMIYSELIVWLIAIYLNVYFIFKDPDIYDSTVVLKFLKHILMDPFTYGAIIIISAIGTFLSVYIGDELVDGKKAHYKKNNFIIKHKILIFVFLIILVVILYDFLIKKMGISIPLL